MDVQCSSDTNQPTAEVQWDADASKACWDIAFEGAPTAKRRRFSSLENCPSPLAAASACSPLASRLTVLFSPPRQSSSPVGNLVVNPADLHTLTSTVECDVCPPVAEEIVSQPSQSLSPHPSGYWLRKRHRPPPASASGIQLSATQSFGSLSTASQRRRERLRRRRVTRSSSASIVPSVRAVPAATIAIPTDATSTVNVTPDEEEEAEIAATHYAATLASILSAAAASSVAATGLPIPSQDNADSSATSFLQSLLLTDTGNSPAEVRDSRRDRPPARNGEFKPPRPVTSTRRNRPVEPTSSRTAPYIGRASSSANLQTGAGASISAPNSLQMPSRPQRQYSTSASSSATTHATGTLPRTGSLEDPYSRVGGHPQPPPPPRVSQLPSHQMTYLSHLNVAQPCHRDQIPTLIPQSSSDSFPAPPPYVNRPVCNWSTSLPVQLTRNSHGVGRPLWEAPPPVAHFYPPCPHATHRAPFIEDAYRHPSTTAVPHRGEEVRPQHVPMTASSVPFPLGAPWLQCPPPPATAAAPLESSSSGTSATLSAAQHLAAASAAMTALYWHHQQQSAVQVAYQQAAAQFFASTAPASAAAAPPATHLAFHYLNSPAGAAAAAAAIMPMFPMVAIDQVSLVSAVPPAPGHLAQIPPSSLLPGMFATGFTLPLPMHFPQMMAPRKRGLSRHELEGLRTYKLATKRKEESSSGTSANETPADREEDALKCMVCLDEVEPQHVVRALRCSHEFHHKCIDKWLRSNRSCPVCRRDAYTGKSQQ